jgi:hypothetical protein
LKACSDEEGGKKFGLTINRLQDQPKYATPHARHLLSAVGLLSLIQHNLSNLIHLSANAMPTPRP